MKLTVLGCAGSFPTANSPCSCYLIEADGFRLLLDFGTGSLGALQQHNLLHSIDAVIISHLHLDHCGDAALYTTVRRYDPRGPFNPLPLYGPNGTMKRISQIVNGNMDAIQSIYDPHIVTPSRFTIGPFVVTAVLMNHPIETYGYRLEYAGRVLAYSADTGPSNALVDLARDANVFLCEAASDDRSDKPTNLHLSGREAGEHAARAHVQRLLLTHLVPEWVDPTATVAAAKAAFAGDVVAVHPGFIYHI